MQLVVLGGTVTESEADALCDELAVIVLRTRPQLLVMDLLPGVAMDDTVVGMLRAAADIATDLGIKVECRCGDPALRAGILAAHQDH